MASGRPGAGRRSHTGLREARGSCRSTGGPAAGRCRAGTARSPPPRQPPPRATPPSGASRSAGAAARACRFVPSPREGIVAAAMPEIPTFDHDTVLKAVTPLEAIERVRDGFVRHAASEWEMPAKTYLLAP